MKKFWGKGYATEAAEACLELGFNQFNMKAIVGRAMPANVASVRVLEKIGLSSLKIDWKMMWKKSFIKYKEK